MVSDRKGVATMKTLALRWIGPAVVLFGSLSGLGGSKAQAQFFGFSYNSPGLSIGVNQPYYGGYYRPPVVLPPPVVVAPPVVYGARPFYPGAYGYRGGYYGGPRGPYGYGRRPY